MFWFLDMAGEQAQKVFSTMSFSEDECEQIEPLVKACHNYCTGKSNIIITRYKFNTHNQMNETNISPHYAIKSKTVITNYFTTASYVTA